MDRQGFIDFNTRLSPENLFKMFLFVPKNEQIGIIKSHFRRYIKKTGTNGVYKSK